MRKKNVLYESVKIDIKETSVFINKSDFSTRSLLFLKNFFLKRILLSFVIFCKRKYYTISSTNLINYSHVMARSYRDKDEVSWVK